MSLLQYKERRGTSCAKWDQLASRFGDPDLLAMWVADMDFKEPECVTRALKSYLDGTPFGYYLPRPGYYEAFIEWELQYHGYRVDPSWICFAPGVMPAINWIIQFSTRPKDAVILLTPVYYPFLDAIKRNDRTLVMCDLARSGMDYSIDFERFEQEIIKSHAKLFLMSSPHNPVGRVWTPEELRQLMEICRRHSVLVISDEIHQDFTFAGHRHCPTASVGEYNEFLITVTAPSKTFNLAALQNAVVIIPDTKLRQSYRRCLQQMRYETGNAFGYIAAEAAFREGRPWLEELLEYIYANYLFIREQLALHAPDVRCTSLEGTYLLWISFENRFSTHAEMAEFAQSRCRLAPDYGCWFGGDRFAPFIRLNLATSRKNVETAVHAIVQGLKA